MIVVAAHCKAGVYGCWCASFGADSEKPSFGVVDEPLPVRCPVRGFDVLLEGVNDLPPLRLADV